VRPMPRPGDEPCDGTGDSRAGRTNRMWSTVAATMLQLLTISVVLPLLRWAARRDRHFHTNFGRAGDELIRTGAGTFLLAGLLGALPACLAALIARPRWPSIVLVAGCLVIALVCEAVVSLAPEPWFTF